MSRGRRLAIRAAILLAGVYAAACLVGRLTYRRFLYPAPPFEPVALAAPAERLAFRASDGVSGEALLFPAPGGAGRTVVHFHGNGQTVAESPALAAALAKRGLGLAAIEYRGYGAVRDVAPSEEGLYADASGALDALAARGIGPERVVLWGTSLGSGIAAEMARRGRGSAVVLVAPYTSITEVAARFVWILPTRVVVPDRYDTLGKASSIRVPTLVIHGTDDALIPYAMGRTLSGAIEGARLRTVPGGGHNDLFTREGDALFDEIARHAGAPPPGG